MSNSINVRDYIGRISEWWTNVDLSRKEYDYFDREYMDIIKKKLKETAEEQENLDRLLDKARIMMMAEDE